jgi:hypothetical protein
MQAEVVEGVTVLEVGARRVAVVVALEQVEMALVPQTALLIQAVEQAGVSLVMAVQE